MISPLPSRPTSRRRVLPAGWPLAIASALLLLGPVHTIQAQPSDHDRPPREHGPQDERPQESDNDLFHQRMSSEERRLVTETVVDLRDILLEMRPDWRERAPILATGDPDEIAPIMARFFPNIRELAHLKGDDPAFYDLRINDISLGLECRSLAWRYHRAKGQEKADEAEQLAGELEARLAEHFDVRLRIREREIAALEQQLTHMRDQFAHDREQRDALLHDRYEHFLHPDAWRRGPRRPSNEGRDDDGQEQAQDEEQSTHDERGD